LKAANLESKKFFKTRLGTIKETVACADGNTDPVAYNPAGACGSGTPAACSKTAEPKPANAERLEAYLSTTDLEKRIIRQIEHYFGDHNLPRDRFMQAVMQETDGWIPIETLLTFKRLRELSGDAEQIMMAVCKSVNRIVQVSFSSRQLRRHPDNPIPDMRDEVKRREIEDRSVYVGGFDRCNTTLDDLLDFFEGQFEKVCNVRMRFRFSSSGKKENSPNKDRQFLGSVFVTFETRQAARKLVRLAHSERGLRYKGDLKLSVKFQKEFLDQRAEDNDEFLPDHVSRTLFIQGFDNADTEDIEILDFFAPVEGSETVKKRLYRDHTCRDNHEGQWMFTGSVFICFESEMAAQCFYMQQLETPLRFKGDKLKVLWQAEFYEQKNKFKRDLQEWKRQQQCVTGK